MNFFGKREQKYDAERLISNYIGTKQILRRFSYEKIYNRLILRTYRCSAGGNGIGGL